MAVFDSTTLLYLLDPSAKPPIDRDTNQPVARAKERVDLLLANFKGREEAVLIPTPVLCEVLVGAGDAGPQYLEILSDTSRFRIAPFDERAAVELAEMTRSALSAGDLRAGAKTTRAKLKFDRQILAIARVEGEKIVYSDDQDIARLGKPLGFTVIPIRELPSPVVQEGLGLGLESS